MARMGISGTAAMLLPPPRRGPGLRCCGRDGERAQCASRMDSAYDPTKSTGSLPEPRLVFVGSTVRTMDAGKPVGPQIRQLVTSIEGAVDAAFQARGGTTQPQAASQGFGLFITRPDPARGDRLYRFRISFQLDRGHTPPGLRPRYFAESVRRDALGVLSVGDDGDTEFAALLTEVRRTVTSAADPNESVRDPNALIDPAPDPNRTGAIPFCPPMAMASDIATTCLVSRKYPLAILTDPDAATLLRALEDGVAAIEAALRQALATRGAIIDARPESHRVLVDYVVPTPEGESRRFHFEIELQTASIEADGVVTLRIAPRLFAEVTRTDTQGILCKERENDPFFAALVQEVDSILRELARG